MYIPNKTVLQQMITSYFNVESDRLDLLANWVKHSHLPASEGEIEEFKNQLRESLNNPGTITPEIYENCTDDDAFDTQEKVQQRLQETWDACFG